MKPVPLAEGETYVGAIGDAAGNTYHVILLPGDNDDASWQAQKEWAASIGGDLPTKLEIAMLFANCDKDQFQSSRYWTGEPFIDPHNPTKTGWAWSQNFNYGHLYTTHKSYEFRARAVRRVEAEESTC